MAGPGVGDDRVLVISVVVDDARHRLPAVLDVVKVAPNVAGADDRLVVWLEKGKVLCRALLRSMNQDKMFPPYIRRK